MNNYTNELYHHGILGQKWGVRRYQNPDGSLTPEGRKRYLKSDGSLTEEGKKYFSKKPSRAMKKAYKERITDSISNYVESDASRTISKEIGKRESEQDDEYYEHEDEFYTKKGGTDRYWELNKEIEQLRKKDNAMLDEQIVKDLLKTYSAEEIRWLDKNTVMMGRRASMSVLNKYEKQAKKASKVSSP
jgi:hypothetical protein